MIEGGAIEGGERDQMEGGERSEIGEGLHRGKR